MKKFGILFIISGACLFLFQVLSSLTGKELNIDTISDIISNKWIESLPEALREYALIVTSNPLTLELFIIGGILMIIGGFKKN